MMVDLHNLVASSNFFLQFNFLKFKDMYNLYISYETKSYFNTINQRIRCILTFRPVWADLSCQEAWVDDGCQTADQRSRPDQGQLGYFYDCQDIFWMCLWQQNQVSLRRRQDIYHLCFCQQKQIFSEDVRTCSSSVSENKARYIELKHFLFIIEP